jgi:hypothetical protein
MEQLRRRIREKSGTLLARPENGGQSGLFPLAAQTRPVQQGYRLRQASLGRPVQHPAYAGRDRATHSRRAAQIHDPSPGLIGEVQTGEFPVQLDRLAVVGPGRLGRVVEQPDIKDPAPMPDPGLPLVSARIDAAEPRNTRIPRAIDAVLPPRGIAQIDPVIVQAIAVLVVHHHARRRVHDHPVHVAQPAMAACVRVERLAATGRRTPCVLAEPFIIRRIDQRTQPVHIDQRNGARLLPRPLLRPDPLPKRRTPLLGLDRGQPPPALVPIGADQQRLALVLDSHGEPAVAATALAAFIRHSRDPWLVPRDP